MCCIRLRHGLKWGHSTVTPLAGHRPALCGKHENEDEDESMPGQHGTPANSAGCHAVGGAHPVRCPGAAGWPGRPPGKRGSGGVLTRWPSRPAPGRATGCRRASRRGGGHGGPRALPGQPCQRLRHWRGDPRGRRRPGPAHVSFLCAHPSCGGCGGAETRGGGVGLALGEEGAAGGFVGGDGRFGWGGVG